MPYKSGKLKGELTAPELRRMIKEHNKLMSIKIPPKTDRDGLIKLINDNGYKVNHEAQKLVPSVQMKRRPTIKLPPAPTPKTAEEKADAKKQKDKKKLEDNLKLKMKVQKVKSKVSDSEMKAKQSEPKKPEPKPEPKKPEPKKPEPKKIDEELWTEFKELVEENKDKLLNIIRPEDKKLKNQYDYYISKYNNRKKPDSLPAKKMMALLKKKLK